MQYKMNMHQYNLVSLWAAKQEKKGVALELKITDRNYENNEIYFDVSIEIKNIIDESWELLGLRSRKTGEVLLHTTKPEYEKDLINVAAADKEFYCDHCGSNRKRLAVVYLRNIETKEIKQIGNSCLSHFGISGIHNYVNAVLSIDDHVKKEIKRNKNVLSFVETATICSNYILTSDYKYSTSVLHIMINRNSFYKYNNSWVAKTMEARESLLKMGTDNFQKIMDFYAQQSYSEDNVKEFNIKRMFTLDEGQKDKIINEKALNWIIEGCWMYVKAEAERKRKEQELAALATANNVKVGEIGSLVNIEVTIEKSYTTQRIYNRNVVTVHIINMVTADNVHFVWFSSSALARQLKQKTSEEKVKIQGIIHSFNTFRGIKQTILKDVKLVD